MKEADAWTPPAHVVPANRLNKANEPLLYTSLNITAALEESRIEEDTPACVFRYRAKREIKVNMIGDRFDDLEVDADELMKVRIWADFLHDEFTRDAGPENQHVYRLSEMIAKEYFDLPPREIQDAWGFPSVVHRPEANICFRPDLCRDCLALDGALVGLRDRESLKVAAIATLENGKFAYHAVGSPKQVDVFPELIK